MGDRTKKAIRLIHRLRQRNAHARDAVIAQAHIIAELSCARSDLFDLANKPLNFLRALLAELRETIDPGISFRVWELKNGMRFGISLSSAHEWDDYDVTEQDYDKSFEQFLNEIKKHRETKCQHAR